ncbi:hypothetical protein ABK040_012279 [Willaertia magna]
MKYYSFFGWKGCKRKFRPYELTDLNRFLSKYVTGDNRVEEFTILNYKSYLGSVLLTNGSIIFWNDITTELTNRSIVINENDMLKRINSNLTTDGIFIKLFQYDEMRAYSLTNTGNLYYWDNNMQFNKVVTPQNIALFCASYYNILLVTKDDPKVLWVNGENSNCQVKGKQNPTVPSRCSGEDIRYADFQVRYTFDNNITNIQIADRSCFVLLENGLLYSFGNNERYNLGFNDRFSPVNPVLVGDCLVEKFHVNDEYTTIICKDGTVKRAGYVDSRSTRLTTFTTSVPITNGTKSIGDILNIITEPNYYMFIFGSNGTFVYGEDANGYLGIGNENIYCSGEQIKGLNNVTKIATPLVGSARSSTNTYIVKENDSWKVFGKNLFSQFVPEEYEYQSTLNLPVDFNLPKIANVSNNFEQLLFNQNVGMAVTENNKLLVWGDSFLGKSLSPSYYSILDYNVTKLQLGVYNVGCFGNSKKIYCFSTSGTDYIGKFGKANQIFEMNSLNGNGDFTDLSLYTATYGSAMTNNNSIIFFGDLKSTNVLVKYLNYNVTSIKAMYDTLFAITINNTLLIGDYTQNFELKTNAMFDGFSVSKIYGVMNSFVVITTEQEFFKFTFDTSKRIYSVMKIDTGNFQVVEANMAANDEVIFVVDTLKCLKGFNGPNCDQTDTCDPLIDCGGHGVCFFELFCTSTVGSLFCILDALLMAAVKLPLFKALNLSVMVGFLSNGEIIDFVFHIIHESIILSLIIFVTIVTLFNIEEILNFILKLKGQIFGVLKENLKKEKVTVVTWYFLVHFTLFLSSLIVFTILAFVAFGIKLHIIRTVTEEYHTVTYLNISSILNSSLIIVVSLCCLVIIAAKKWPVKNQQIENQNVLVNLKSRYLIYFLVIVISLVILEYTYFPLFVWFKSTSNETTSGVLYSFYIVFDIMVKISLILLFTLSTIVVVSAKKINEYRDLILMKQYISDIKENAKQLLEKDLENDEDYLPEELLNKKDNFYVRKILISIGVDNVNGYEIFENNLTASQDAESVATSLKDYHQFDDYRVIKNEMATKDNIKNTIRELKTKRDDLLVLYFAGHGAFDRGDGPFIVYCYDDIVDFGDIITELRIKRAKHKLILLDSCFSGGIFRGGGKRKNKINTLISPSVSENEKTLFIEKEQVAETKSPTSPISTSVTSTSFNKINHEVQNTLDKSLKKSLISNCDVYSRPAFKAVCSTLHDKLAGEEHEIFGGGGKFTKILNKILRGEDLTKVVNIPKERNYLKLKEIEVMLEDELSLKSRQYITCVNNYYNNNQYIQTSTIYPSSFNHHYHYASSSSPFDQHHYNKQTTTSPLLEVNNYDNNQYNHTTSHHYEVNNNYFNNQNIQPTSPLFEVTNLNYNNQYLTSPYHKVYNALLGNNLLQPYIQTTLPSFEINNLNYNNQYSTSTNSEVNNNYILNTLINNNKDNICYNNIKNNVININNKNTTSLIIEVNKNEIIDLINNKSKKKEKKFDIIKEMGDFKFECKYRNKKLCKMDIIQREILKSQFKIFAYAVRNVIFNLMNINEYKYKKNVIVGCIDFEVFYYFFYEMDGAVFKKKYQTLKKNGYKEKELCIIFKFKNVLPVLYNVNSWGIHEYEARIIGKNNEIFITIYKLNIEYIIFVCNLNNYIETL